MNEKTAAEQAEEFLALSGEFRLGELVTESPHPVTCDLSSVAAQSAEAGLGLLFDVDADVVETYRRWSATEAPGAIAESVIEALRGGGKVIFTGCGATGRLSILLDEIWRKHWREIDPSMSERTRSVMSGGDYALIKSVEGFEDFQQFGAKQMEEIGVSAGDVVFAITEGGETSFVIGTAWRGLQAGAKVYFVYCNPDDALRRLVTRSREVLDEPRIEKVNLTTGPMAITGSTRMQATSIQLCAMLTVLEIVCERIAGRADAESVPERFLAALEATHEALRSPATLGLLARAVEAEERAYRSGRRSSYFAGRLGIDVLTDTTERSPTFCTPAFRKWDDQSASDSWTYLTLPYPDAESAWGGMLGRPPLGLAWSDEEIRSLVGDERAARQSQIMAQIGPKEILRFRIGVDGLKHRPVREGDHAVCVVTESEIGNPFFEEQLRSARDAGASTALIALGRPESLSETLGLADASVLIPVPDTDFAIVEMERIAVKMALNALSTCVMVRLGRVLGNCMVAVVPSNLKLIDRSIRYIVALTGLSYENACHELFQSIEAVRPAMTSGREYQPPVELTVNRVRHQRHSARSETESQNP